jgi:hypothetical protein
MLFHSAANKGSLTRGVVWPWCGHVWVKLSTPKQSACGQGDTRQQNETTLPQRARQELAQAMAAACAVSAPSLSANQALLNSSRFITKLTPRLPPSLMRTRAFRVRAAKLPSGVSELNKLYMILHMHIISQYLTREELVQGRCFILLYYCIALSLTKNWFRSRYPGCSQSWVSPFWGSPRPQRYGTPGPAWWASLAPSSLSW